MSTKLVKKILFFNKLLKKMSLYEMFFKT